MRIQVINEKLIIRASKLELAEAVFCRGYLQMSKEARKEVQKHFKKDPQGKNIFILPPYPFRRERR